MYIEPLWAKSSNLIPSLPNFPHPLYSILKLSPSSEKNNQSPLFEVFVAESQEKEKEVKQRGGGIKGGGEGKGRKSQSGGDREEKEATHIHTRNLPGMMYLIIPLTSPRGRKLENFQTMISNFLHSPGVGSWKNSKRRSRIFYVPPCGDHFVDFFLALTAFFASGSKVCANFLPSMLKKRIFQGKFFFVFGGRRRNKNGAKGRRDSKIEDVGVFLKNSSSVNE